MKISRLKSKEVQFNVRKKNLRETLGFYKFIYN